MEAWRGHAGGEAAEQRERVHVDRNRPVGVCLLQCDAYQAIRPRLETLFVNPRYPAVAIAARVQGEVTIDCVIGPDGKIYEARVLAGNVLLRQAALDAVRRWRYTRPRLNDTPISVLLTVKVDFQLR